MDVVDLPTRLRQLEEDERNLKEHAKSLEELAAESSLQQATDSSPSTSSSSSPPPPSSSSSYTVGALQLKYVERQIDTYVRLIAANLTEQRRIRHQLRTDHNHNGDTPSSHSKQRKMPSLPPAAAAPPPAPPQQPPSGYAFELSPPQSILPSRLLKRRVFFWSSGEGSWFVGEVVGGPKDPKQSNQGYTLQVRSSKILDPTSPEHLRREAQGLRLNVSNYGQTWFLLNDAPPPEEAAPPVEEADATPPPVEDETASSTDDKEEV